MDLPARLEGYARYTFVDGVFAPTLSQPTNAFDTDAMRIVARANGKSPLKLEVLFLTGAAAPADPVHSRLDLQIEARARVSLIERHLGPDSTAHSLNSALNLAIDADAGIEHYRLQQTGASATWNDTLSATVAAGASYGLYCIGLGGQSAHSTLQIRLAGERAQLALHTVSVADRNQAHETSALIEHAAADTRTEENFRGIAGGKARVAFNGKIVVRETAHGTDSCQSLRGLITGQGARVDLQPHLEIYNNDVKCSHGATTGKLDETMLFYLLSRGLDRETAQRLLKWAFLEDVVAKIAVADLRRQIEQSLAGHLNEVAVLEEMV